MTASNSKASLLLSKKAPPLKTARELRDHLPDSDISPSVKWPAPGKDTCPSFHPESPVADFVKSLIGTQEKEKQWLTSELHDRLAQPLALAMQQLRILSPLSRDYALIEPPLQRAMTLLQTAIRECRNIVDSLYSPVLSDFGLVPAIQEELDTLAKETGCITRCNIRLPIKLPQEIETALYRIFHESITNIRRHAAGARHVSTNLIGDDHAVALQVKDDGPGFDTIIIGRRKRSSGIDIMRWRAALLGGDFEVVSSPGQGTLVSVRIPVNP